jgi:uncharacterized protein (TIGR02186 family)
MVQGSRGPLPAIRLALLAGLPACGLCFFSLPAPAGGLVTSLSAETIKIHSNFTGADLTLFGVVDQKTIGSTGVGTYDVVVTIQGPRGSLAVREKKRVGPFWINADERKYIAIPAFIAVLANRPLDAVAPAKLRMEEHLGIETLVPAQAVNGRPTDPDEPFFRRALIRLRERQRLFRDFVPGVSFVTPTVFRAAIHLPGNAPLGAYLVTTTLLSDGKALAHASQTFSVGKSGFEQELADTARDRPILYGIGTSAFALLVGWLATVVFRRD